MGYSLKEEFGGKDTEAYARYKEGQKAGKWEDFPDFLSQGGNTSTGKVTSSPSISSIVEEIMSAGDAIIEDETGWVDDYIGDNPFVFDEALAKESATLEYEPYYSELLDDYLYQVDEKRTTIQDDEKLAQELFQSESGTLSRAYDRAVSEAQSGFAGKGLFYSGIKKRTLGKADVEYEAAQEEREGGRAAGRETSERGLSQLDILAGKKERDIGREQETAIESGILKRQSEAQKQYRTGLEQTYYRRFPSGSGNALKGYVVPEYLRF